MSEELILSPGLRESQRARLALIHEIARAEYQQPGRHFVELLADVVSLYDGRWPAYEACQVGYHNLDHALDVALAVTRMAAGWNRRHPDQPLPAEVFAAGVAAALFHDAGYLKDKGDPAGRGGKFTFTHVGRSADLAGRYLTEKNWPARVRRLVPRIIALTDFNKEPVWAGLFDSRLEEVMARMVATADLVAQMADVDYLSRLKDLYEEFEEGYRFENKENLAARGINIYKSLQEMLDGTFLFYEQFVLPRLEALDRMDRYLVAFFGDGRNPYQENIITNLSGQFKDQRAQWRRLGEILVHLGVVTAAQIDEALRRQRLETAAAERPDGDSGAAVGMTLLAWANQPAAGNYLGAILMEMGALDPLNLCRGLLTQMLPLALLERLSRAELLFLLRIFMLLDSSRQGAWVLAGILELANEQLGCETSSLLLFDKGADEMVVAVAAGPDRAFLKNRRLPVDKGLAGWVCRHQRPARVENGSQSVLAAPLHINGEAVGALELLNKKQGTFTEHDEDLLTVLANAVGAALGNILQP